MSFDKNPDFDITDIAPEHKSGIAAARGEHDDFRAPSRNSRRRNDERLARLEQKRGDVLLEEKVDRINAALDAQHRRLDELALKNARPALDGPHPRRPDASAREHKSAFDAYVRGGESRRLAPDRDQGDVGRLECRWRLSGAGGTRARRSARGCGDLADPRASRPCARSPATSTRSRS